MAMKGGKKLVGALREMSDKLKKAHVVKVGFFENATYPDGTQVALVAAVHNWGAPKRGIPPRPFFSNAVAINKPSNWPKAIRQALVATDYDAEKALELVGEHVKGDVQQAIRDFVGVPLKPRTVKAKGFDKQLVNSAHMLNSVDKQVS